MITVMVKVRTRVRVNEGCYGLKVSKYGGHREEREGGGMSLGFKLGPGLGLG